MCINFCIILCNHVPYGWNQCHDVLWRGNSGSCGSFAKANLTLTPHAFLSDLFDSFNHLDQDPREKIFDNVGIYRPSYLFIFNCLWLFHRVISEIIISAHRCNYFLYLPDDLWPHIRTCLLDVGCRGTSASPSRLCCHGKLVRSRIRNDIIPNHPLKITRQESSLYFHLLRPVYFFFAISNKQADD